VVNSIHFKTLAFMAIQSCVILRLITITIEQRGPVSIVNLVETSSSLQLLLVFSSELECYGIRWYYPNILASLGNKNGLMIYSVYWATGLKTCVSQNRAEKQTARALCTIIIIANHGVLSCCSMSNQRPQALQDQARSGSFRTLRAEMESGGIVSLVDQCNN